MAATAPPGLFDQFSRGWRGYVLIALLALGSALIGANRVPVTDVDEARFAQATRQMVEGGDYVRIRLQAAERNRKPVGIHWLQAASVTTFSPDRLNVIWPYRLPSALGLVLACIATLWAGTALVGARAGFIGAALFAVSLLASAQGMLATTDAAMTGFTTLALATLAQLRAGTGRSRLVALMFWAAIGCGILIKGPVTPLVAALTLGALALWERRTAWMKPIAFWPGPALAVLIVLPWLIAIGAATDGRFFAGWIGDIAPKIIGGDRAHGGAPGYHLLLLPVLIFPATYALPAALRISWGAMRTPASNNAQAPYRFLIAWAAPTFAFFELMPTKLIHYTLPAYPAIALLCGVGLLLASRARWRTAHPAGVVIFIVAGAVIVALMATVSTFMPGNLADAGLRRAIGTALLGVLTLGGATACLVFVRHPAARVGALIGCALIFSFSLRERLLPEARTLFVSNEAVAAMTRARIQARDDERFWVVGYEQPSIVFLTRTSIRLVPAQSAGDAGPGDGMIVEGRVLEEAERALEARGLVFEQAEPPVRGMALGRGERMALYVGRVSDQVAEQP